MTRILVSICAFFGAWILGGVAFAIWKINAAFNVAGHNITNPMVVFAIAIMIGALTFNRYHD